MGQLTGALNRLNDELLEKVRARQGQDSNFVQQLDRDLPVILRLARAFDLTPPDEVPPNILDLARRQLEQVAQACEQIANMPVDADNMSSLRQSVKSTLSPALNEYRQQVHPHIRPDVDAGERLSRAEEANSAASEALERAKAAEDVFQQLAESAQIRLAEIGAGYLSKYYGEQADKYRSAAKRWLVTAAASSAVAVLAAAVLFATLEIGVSTTWMVFAREVGARLFVLGLLGYAIGFSVRAYRSNTHLRVIDERKRNALDTFPLFAESATTDEQRGLLTLELVRAVFAPEDTGFLDEVSDRAVASDSTALLSLLLSRTVPQGR